MEIDRVMRLLRDISSEELRIVDSLGEKKVEVRGKFKVEAKSSGKEGKRVDLYSKGEVVYPDGNRYGTTSRWIFKVVEERLLVSRKRYSGETHLFTLDDNLNLVEGDHH